MTPIRYQLWLRRLNLGVPVSGIEQQEARELVERANRRFDPEFIDLPMPDGNGWRVTSKRRAQEVLA